MGRQRIPQTTSGRDRVPRYRKSFLERRENRSSNIQRSPPHQLPFPPLDTLICRPSGARHLLLLRPSRNHTIGPSFAYDSWSVLMRNIPVSLPLKYLVGILLTCVAAT